MKWIRPAMPLIRWKAIVSAFILAAHAQSGFCGGVEWLEALSRESFSATVHVELKGYCVTNGSRASKRPFLGRKSEILLDGERVYERAIISQLGTESAAEYVFAFDGEYSTFYNPQKNMAFRSNEPAEEENIFIQMLSGSRARGGVLLSRERSILYPLRQTFALESATEVRADGDTEWFRFPTRNVGFDGYVEMNAEGLATGVGSPLWQIMDNNHRIATCCTVAGKPIQVRSKRGEVFSLPSSIMVEIHENSDDDKPRHLQYITTITHLEQNVAFTQDQFEVSLQPGTVIRDKLLRITSSDASSSLADEMFSIDLISNISNSAGTSPPPRDMGTGETGSEAETAMPREEVRISRSEREEDRQPESAMAQESGIGEQKADYGYVYLLAVIFLTLGAASAYTLYHKVGKRR